MPEREQDPEREVRIAEEIVVDAYGSEEQALGWYYYLEKNLAFPFVARCIRERATSPLQIADEVEVVGMPKEEECEREMLVCISGKHRPLAVPLAQLELVRADTGAEETREAIADWHYWVDRGYQL
jgi:hypothetical protein